MRRTTEPAVEAIGLVQTFGTLRALDGLDLAVGHGELLGLVGPNGAGKTTFIRVIAGLLRPSAGSIRVLGGSPGPVIAARIGYMTQSPALYEDLSIRDNLVFFGRLFGLSAPDARSRAQELAVLVELEAREQTPVRLLSGGMRQRTNLACAMVHRPQLLLLDEPTVGVDPLLRRRLWDYFGHLNDDGTTILVTTHVMDEAERCARVVLLSDGRTIGSGPPADLRRRSGTATLEEAFLAYRDLNGDG